MVPSSPGVAPTCQPGGDGLVDVGDSVPGPAEGLPDARIGGGISAQRTGEPLGNPLTHDVQALAVDPAYRAGMQHRTRFVETKMARIDSGAVRNPNSRTSWWITPPDSPTA